MAEFSVKFLVLVFCTQLVQNMRKHSPNVVDSYLYVCFWERPVWGCAVCTHVDGRVIVQYVEEKKEKKIEGVRAELIYYCLYS